MKTKSHVNQARELLDPLEQMQRLLLEMQERIKAQSAEDTEWRLPEPPASQQWHTLDGWKESDLPEGWRPLLDGEMPQSGDEVFQEPTWSKQDRFQCEVAACDLQDKQRTRRPLPAALDAPKPEPTPAPPDSSVQMVIEAAEQVAKDSPNGLIDVTFKAFAQRLRELAKPVTKNEV